MKSILLHILIFTTLFVSSCVAPLDNFQQVANKSFLTIEATLNNLSEPQTVYLFMSSPDVENTYFLPISNATIFYTDEKGVRTDLSETSLKGIYQTSGNFVGRIGGTYTLTIETRDGKKYKSLPETMRPVPEIENLINRFEILDNYGVGDPQRAGFNLYLDFQDLPSEGDNYQWTWKHYQKLDYNICTTCLKGYFDFRLNTCVLPRPATEKNLSYECDGTCLDISYSTDLNLFSDAYSNGQRVTGKKVARIPYDDITPYYLQLEQRGITKNSYNYYQSLKIQTQNTGTLFDVPAETRYSVNIKSTTNPDEKILGVFDVFSSKKKVFYIDRTKGTGTQPVKNIPLESTIFVCTPLDVQERGCKDKTSCQENRYRTKIKPEGWRD